MNNLNYEEIFHSGILGMKWGVRRYQNKDGTLTEAGKRRYGKYRRDDGHLTREGIYRYGDGTNGLNRRGRKLLKQVDPESSTGRDLRKIDRMAQFNRDNYATYNKACELFSERVKKLNSDFGDSGTDNPKYMKAVSKLWKDTYAREATKKFNKDGLLDDESYEEWLPFYNAFDD